MLYKGYLRKQNREEYVHASSIKDAVHKLQRRCYQKYGNFDLSDLHCKYETGWSRVPFVSNREYFTEREYNANQKM